jgi:hypothetical protein
MFEFRITRVSNGSKDVCPCDDAYYVEELHDWFISFQNMSELMNFVNREGKIVLDNDFIYIYDDYME